MLLPHLVRLQTVDLGLSCRTGWEPFRTFFQTRVFGALFTVIDRFFLWDDSG